MRNILLLIFFVLFSIVRIAEAGRGDPDAGPGDGPQDKLPAENNNGSPHTPLSFHFNSGPGTPVSEAFSPSIYDLLTYEVPSHPQFQLELPSLGGQTTGQDAITKSENLNPPAQIETFCTSAPFQNNQTILLTNENIQTIFNTKGLKSTPDRTIPIKISTREEDKKKIAKKISEIHIEEAELKALASLYDPSKEGVTFTSYQIIHALKLDSNMTMDSALTYIRQKTQNAPIYEVEKKRTTIKKSDGTPMSLDLKLYKAEDMPVLANSIRKNQNKKRKMNPEIAAVPTTSDLIAGEPRSLLLEESYDGLQLDTLRTPKKKIKSRRKKASATADAKEDEKKYVITEPSQIQIQDQELTAMKNFAAPDGNKVTVRTIAGLLNLIRPEILYRAASQYIHNKIKQASIKTKNEFRDELGKDNSRKVTVIESKDLTRLADFIKQRQDNPNVGKLRKAFT